VIEHLENPKEVLQTLSQYLHSDGYFIIETSNIDSFDYFLKKKKWGYWHIDHFYYYSNETLNYLLESIDFEIVNIEPKENKLQTELKVKKRIRYKELLNLGNFWININYICFLIFKRKYSKNSLMTIVARRKS
jgi:2-polyprenyl-3-methyl-5-hydroxy-6-metoxy-1,4-benzoquinol methylase